MAVVLAEIDSRLTDRVDLHCPGGFVVADLYDISRTTTDLDRNINRDREDVQRVARYPGLDRVLLEQRYRRELRRQSVDRTRAASMNGMFMIAAIAACRSVLTG